MNAMHKAYSNLKYYHPRRFELVAPLVDLSSDQDVRIRRAALDYILGFMDPKPGREEKDAVSPYVPDIIKRYQESDEKVQDLSNRILKELPDDILTQHAKHFIPLLGSKKRYTDFATYFLNHCTEWDNVRDIHQFLLKRETGQPNRPSEAHRNQRKLQYQEKKRKEDDSRALQLEIFGEELDLDEDD